MDMNPIIIYFSFTNTPNITINIILSSCEFKEMIPSVLYVAGSSVHVFSVELVTNCSHNNRLFNFEREFVFWIYKNR